MFLDGAGKALNGANRYVLHFAKDGIPPVNAIWSVTMYNGANFLAANPLNRYALRSADKLTYNSDGSLDIYIQKDSPGADKESNWLPAPAGDFNIMMRLYWPKDAALKGTWKPSAIQMAP